MTPHIHHWKIEEKGNALIYTCTTAGCRTRRIVEEFDLPDEPLAPRYAPDAMFVHEAQRPAAILRGIGVGLLIVGAILLLTHLITGRFWP